MQFIKTNTEGKLGRLILDNDNKSNSLNLTMLEEFEKAFAYFTQKNCRVVIIQANQKVKVWCAGLQIDQLPDPEFDPVPYEYSLEKILKCVENFPGIVIAMINGSVWGGGCELAFSCDILIGSPSASFSITPAKISAPYNPNQVNRVLQRVGSNIALEMFSTANIMDAKRAKELGILNHIVSENKLIDFTNNMANKILQNAPLTIALIKKQIHELGTRTVEQLTADDKNRALIKQVYNSHDYKGGKNAFLEKRKPNFTGE